MSIKQTLCEALETNDKTKIIKSKNIYWWEERVWTTNCTFLRVVKEDFLYIKKFGSRGGGIGISIMKGVQKCQFFC